MSRIHRANAAGLVALVLVGCPGDKPGTTTESTGGSSTSTTAEGSSTGTTAGASGQTTASSTGESGEATTGTSGCEAAPSREACVAATPSSEASQCAWAVVYAVSTAGMMCMAETETAGCFEVPASDGECGLCHYRQVGPDLFEVAELDVALGCDEFMPGEFQSCAVEVFACACGCE